MSYFASRVNKGLSRVDPYVPGKPIEEIKRIFNVREIFKLASNENPLGASPVALDAVRKDLRSLHRYPDDSSCELRAGLARRYRVDISQIVIGRGSDELIELSAAAFLDGTSEVVIAQPTFLMYGIASRLKGARVREIPTKGFRYDAAAMMRSITPRTKIVFLGNPDNPCGSYMPKKDFEKLLMRARRTKTLVFVDEAYYEITQKRADYPDGITYLKKGFPNIIVARTFSKAYGLAGLRIGYGITTKELSGYYQKVRPPFNVTRLSQVAALAALGDTRFLQKTRALLRREKCYLYAALERLGVTCVPTDTNFILCECGARAGSIAKALLAQGIIVRFMADWGLDTYIRITVGLPRENKAFIRALTALL